MANEFLPHATGGGSNVITQSAWNALAARLTGFQAGVAKSNEVNKAIRQGTSVAAMIGQFISDHALLDALDDGDLTVLKNRLEVAIRRQDLNYVGAVGGTANALTVTLAPVPVSYTVLIGTPLRLLAAASNTAAATLNVNGLGVKNILRQDGSALGVNDIHSGSIITVIYDGTQFRLFSLIPQTNRAFTLFASAQSLPNTTETGVVFAAPGGGTDPLGFYNAGQPGRLTIPSGITKVKISAVLAFATNATGFRQMRVLQNNGAVPAGGRLDLQLPTGANLCVLQITGFPVAVSPGDYFTVLGIQNSGGSLALDAASTSFTVEY